MRKITALIVTIALITMIVGSCMQGEQRIGLRFKYEPGLVLTYKQIANRSYQVIEADSIVKKDAIQYDIDVEMEFIRFVDDTTYEIAERGEWEYTVPSKEDSTKMETMTRTSETILRTLSNGKIVGADFEQKKNDNEIAYVTNYYEQGMPVFPSGEKPIGYSWTQTTKVVMPTETMEASTTYHLKSEVRHAGYDCAVIEYEGNMILPIEPNPEDSLPRSGLDRVKTNGIMYFAHKEGMIVEQKERWEIDGDRRKLKGDKATDFKVLVQYNTTFTLTNREIKP